jgi:hypothetical protein
MEHWEWVESNCQIKCSEFGKTVAQILGIAWSGVYHMSRTFKKTNWKSERAIEVIVDFPQLSTWDFARLTDIVIMCHDACIRFEVEPHAFRSMRMWFHRRDVREGGMSERHPTIEQAIERVRKYGGPKLEERREDSKIATEQVSVPDLTAAESGIVKHNS